MFRIFIFCCFMFAMVSPVKAYDDMGVSENQTADQEENQEEITETEKDYIKYQKRKMEREEERKKAEKAKEKLLATKKTADDFTGIEKEAFQFIKNAGNEALRIFTLEDRIERYEQTAKLLEDSFDLETIARFSIGKHWRGMTKGERKRYVAAFKPYILALYVNLRWDTDGLGFDVINSIKEKEDLVLVKTLVSGLEAGNDITLNFKVKKREEKLKIVDVVFSGSSINITQRNSFKKMLRKNDGYYDDFILDIEEAGEKFHDDIMY